MIELLLKGCQERKILTLMIPKMYKTINHLNCHNVTNNDSIIIILAISMFTYENQSVKIIETQIWNNRNRYRLKLDNSTKDLRINFYLLQTFCPHLGSFCVVSSFTTFRPNFTSGLLQVIYRDLRLECWVL